MTLKELQEKQSWSLEQKVFHSLEVIGSYVTRLGGCDKVYVSFSGGKDSTVLLHLCQMLYPDIMAVFINTGNEWPEILQFVNRIKDEGKTNLHIIRPEMTPRQVWSQIGFPLVSKEAAQQIEIIRNNPTCKSAVRFLTRDKFGLAKRWRYLIDEPYCTSAKCCSILKKQPAHKFEKETGRKPIIGIMASESILRTSSYIKMGGCNSFSDKRVVSWPLAIWTEQDILDFIEHKNLPIAEIYSKGVTRTGCVGCGFGAYHSDENRPSLKLLYELHPKYYDMIMSYTNNGCTFREAVRKMKQVTKTVLPDE